MMDWIEAHDTLLWWLFSASGVLFIGTLVAVPLVILHLPFDYFAHDRRRVLPWAGLHPVLRMVLLIVKNVLGVVFVCAGMAMLVLPGQGVLTIVVGILLLNFPGKYELERWAATRGPVWRTMNRLRRRASREPFSE
jgi:hypothetical protein